MRPRRGWLAANRLGARAGRGARPVDRPRRRPRGRRAQALAPEFEGDRAPGGVGQAKDRQRPGRRGRGVRCRRRVVRGVAERRSQGPSDRHGSRGVWGDLAAGADVPKARIRGRAVRKHRGIAPYHAELISRHELKLRPVVEPHRHSQLRHDDGSVVVRGLSFGWIGSGGEVAHGPLDLPRGRQPNPRGVREPIEQMVGRDDLVLPVQPIGVRRAERGVVGRNGSRP